MPTYLIVKSFKQTSRKQCVIEAKSEEEAIDRAFKEGKLGAKETTQRSFVTAEKVKK